MTQFQKATLGCLGALVALMLALVVFVYVVTSDTIVEVQLVRQVGPEPVAQTQPGPTTVGLPAVAPTWTALPSRTPTETAPPESTATPTSRPQSTNTATRVIPKLPSPVAQASPRPTATSVPSRAAAVSGAAILKGTSEPLPSDEAIEAASILLINEVRQRAGLPALVRDPVLDEIARERSRDMLKRSYFSHHDPATGDLALEKLFTDHQVQFLQAGENLAYFLGPGLGGDLPSVAVDKWMGSENHRKNIMEADYNLTGFGVAGAPAPEGNVWYLSQVFVQR